MQIEEFPQEMTMFEDDSMNSEEASYCADRKKPCLPLSLGRKVLLVLLFVICLMSLHSQEKERKARIYHYGQNYQKGHNMEGKFDLTEDDRADLVADIGGRIFDQLTDYFGSNIHKSRQLAADCICSALVTFLLNCVKPEKIDRYLETILKEVKHNVTLNKDSFSFRRLEIMENELGFQNEV